ncbi:helix-turn-helix transcriptional regulator [Paucisalibacillus sp. EB02]|uniref:helix-turn-helix transcriptional regulator n=1 Tax=Paucisalibacillus sp. EB02 TaxID=1347087 RepID=UPI0005AB9007|nr:helix-turn-helix transcriptional regulator [Paucisalibacillus sp. EB02]
MNFGDRIKHFRTLNNHTQQEMAKGICSISYLSKIENNVVKPNEEIIELLCTKLNITKNELITEEELSQKMQTELMELSYLIRQKNPNVLSKYDEIIKRFSNLNSPQSELVKQVFGFRIALYKNDGTKATFYYNEIIKNSTYLPDWIDSYYNRFCGLYHYMYGNLEEAKFYYKKAEESTSIEEKEEIYYQLALVYNKLRELGLSTFYLLQAHELFVKKMDYDSCTNCNMLLGINYRRMGEYQRAIETFKKIIQKPSPNTEVDLIGKAYHNLGLIYSDLRNSEKAISCYEESLKIKSHPELKVNTMYLLSKEYLLQIDRKNAIKWYKLGKEAARKFKNEAYIIKFNVLHYEILDLVKTSEYEHYMTNVAIPFFEKIKERQTLSEYVQKLTLYYESIRQYKKSYLLLKEVNNYEKD